MVQAKQGDTITIHYTGYLKDGTVFESTKDKEPFTFTIGRGEIIPGLESGVMGMKEGEIKSISVPPKHAYGNYNENTKFVTDKSKIPSEIKPEIGMKLQARSRNGVVSLVTITEITEDTVTIDANHPLAGKELIFEVKILKIFFENIFEQ